MTLKSLRSAAASFAFALIAAGLCAAQDPAANEKLAKGRALIEQMSVKLAAATVFQASTSDVRERVSKDGKVESVSSNREILVRRPDRFHFKASGDADQEGWYNGNHLTIVLHKEKFYGRVTMPATIDATVDVMGDIYGIPLPLGDLFYSSAASVLLADSTRGGLVGQEDVDGISCNHVAFQDTGVNWEMWIPVAGDPLPRRFKIEYLESPKLRSVDMTFKKWDLAPAGVADATFEPKVPEGYQRISMVKQVLPPEPTDAGSGKPVSESTPGAKSTP